MLHGMPTRDVEWSGSPGCASVGGQDEPSRFELDLAWIEATPNRGAEGLVGERGTRRVVASDTGDHALQGESTP